MDINKIITGTTKEIKNLSHEMRIAHAQIGNVRASLEVKYSDRIITSTDFDPDFWRFVGVHDALSKFIEFTASDINAMDNMELAQRARYFCDLMMWVKHLTDAKKDPREYLEHLLRGKRFHFEKLITHFESEISTLKRIGTNYNLLLLKTAVRAGLLNEPRPKPDRLDQLTRAFHEKMGKLFSIYRSTAFAAYEEYATLVEREILASYKSDLAQLNKQIEDFERTLGRKIAKKHDSNEFAKSVGMTRDYDFIFRLTSQHLHATPLSMSTDMKEISASERLIFLEYIRAKGVGILASSLFLNQGFREAIQPIPGLGPDSYHRVWSRTPKRRLTRPGAGAQKVE